MAQTAQWEPMTLCARFTIIVATREALGHAPALLIPSSFTAVASKLCHHSLVYKYGEDS